MGITECRIDWIVYHFVGFTDVSRTSQVGSLTVIFIIRVVQFLAWLFQEGIYCVDNAPTYSSYRVATESRIANPIHLTYLFSGIWSQ